MRPDDSSGATTLGMPCSNVVDKAVRIDSAELARERQREEAAERPRERQRVVRDAVSGTEHGVLIEAVDGAEARREEALADLDPEVFGNAPDTAEEDVERCQRPRARQIVRAFDPFDAAVGSCHQRVVLVAKPEIECQPRVDLPPVANVERVLPLACGHQLVLDALAGAVR